MTENAQCEHCNPVKECGHGTDDFYRRGFMEGVKYVTSGRLVKDRDFWHKMSDYYRDKVK